MRQFLTRASAHSAVDTARDGRPSPSRVVILAAGLLVGSLLVTLLQSVPVGVGQSAIVGLLGLAATGGARDDDVDHLIAAVERVRDGDYDVELDRFGEGDGGGDDLGRLATAVGEMADAVEERERSLEWDCEYQREMMDAVDDVLYVVGRDGDLRRWNAAKREWSGYTDEELASMTAVETVHPVDRERVADAIEEGFETGSARVEAGYRRDDGTWIPFEFVASRLQDPDGNPVLVGSGRDVSERHARQRERATAQRYRRRLYELVTETDRSDEETIERLLELGCERLGLDSGYVARIDPSTDHHEIAWSSDDDLPAGSVRDLSATFCSHTVDRDDVLALHDATDVALETGPQEDERDAGCYVGAPLVVDRELWGTVCFLDRTPRKEPFSQDEQAFAELVGRWIDHVLEQRDREHRLEVYREYIDDVLDAIDDVFYVLDRERTHTRWNRAFEEVTGYAPEAIAERGIEEFFEDGDAATVRTAMEEAFESGASRIEAPLLTSEGETIPYEFVANRLVAPDGTPVIAGIGRDVSERKAREREHRETRDYLRAIIEASPAGIIVTDTGGTVELWNPAAEEIFGWSADDVVGEMLPIVPDDRWEEFEQSREWLLSGASISRIETKRLTSDGEEIDVLLSAAPIRDAEGEITGVMRAILDVTERKRKQEELERTTNLLEQAQRVASIGGWELDLRRDPPEMTWTDELHDMLEVPRDESIDVHRFLELFDPDDRDRIRTTVETAIEQAEGYDVEERVVTESGEARWIRALADPVVEDGEVVALRGSVQDVTDQKEHELALETLQETARSLLQIESRDAVSDLVVDAAEDLFEDLSIGIYSLDAGSSRLEPAAVTTCYESLCGGDPASVAGETGSPLWQVFLEGEPQPLEETDLSWFADEVESGLVVPLGDDGVFVGLTSTDDIDPEARRIVETLVATTEAALDRLDSEADLRDRETELAAQNRRLSRQIQINEIIRSIDQSLIRASSREEVERAVCERLVESEDVAFAWIGSTNSAGDAVVPRTWAGTNEEYLDAVSLEATGDAPEPAVATALSGEPTVVEAVVERVRSESWRRQALVCGLSSAVSVPLTFDEYGYGVLTVYANEPEGFGDLEATVFAELGENIASTINAVTTSKALHTDAFVELAIALSDADDVLSRIAGAADARTAFVGLATHSEEESRVFLEVAEADGDPVAEVLEELVSVRDFRRVSDGEDGGLFEVTVTGDALPARLVRHGGIVRSVESEGTETEVVVDVPAGTDVREFVEMIREQYPSAELLARRDVTRDVEDEQEVVSSLFDRLTERQLEVLRTAYFAGYFGWPRETTGVEVAELLDVSQPTVNRHIRNGLATILEGLFEEGAARTVEV